MGVQHCRVIREVEEVLRGTRSFCDEKKGNGFLILRRKKKRVSPLPWVLVFGAKLRMLDVTTALSKGVSEELARAGFAPLSGLLHGSPPRLITVFVVQLFFLERQRFPATALKHSGPWSFPFMIEFESFFWC